MPIYEFYCSANNKIYSFYARTLAEGKCLPRCPDQADYKMERVISTFAVTGRAREKTDLPGGAPDDPRMEAAMAQMEREMGGMDSENPDPRQLARMMRTMSSATGEAIPAPMEEMLSRMERGEDPEKLEAEYGDAFDDFGAGEGGEPGAGDSSSVKERGRSLRRSRPVRDPQLYEMRDYSHP